MIDIRNKIINSYLDKNDISNNNLLKMASIINWIECYSEEITYLQEIFLKLSAKIPNLFESIKKIISSEQIEYEISNRNPEYIGIVNKVFFLSLDSILRIITSKPEIYDLSLDNVYELIKVNKEVLQTALKLEEVFKLRSKEVYSLQEILKLLTALYSNKLADVKNVKKIIEYFKEETIYLKNSSIKTLCSNLEDFYKTLEKMMGNLPKENDLDFYKLLSMILFEEFNKIPNEEFRKLILDKILKKNDLIKNSAQIINIIIDNGGIDCNPDSINENINNIKEEASPLFLTLNKTNNVFLEEVIIDIFERKIIKYFEIIPDLEESELKHLIKLCMGKIKKEKIKLE